MRTLLFVICCILFATTLGQDFNCGDGSTTLPPFGVASHYNTFVFGDFSCKYGDTEGRLAAGGNVNLEGYGVGCKVFALPNEHCTAQGSILCAHIAADNEWADTLVSGNQMNLQGVGVRVGNIVHGGSYSGNNVGITSDCAIRQDTPINFTEAQEYLTEVSNKIKAMDATGRVEKRNGGLIFNGTGADIEVFELDPADLASSHRIEFVNIGATSTVLVNVAGLAVEASSMTFVNVPADRTLFNFHEATTLRLLYLSWQGSVLAPKADMLEPQGQILGQVFAKSWVPTSWGGCMEQHHVPFVGCVPAIDCRECGFFCDFDDLKWIGTIGTESVEITPFIIDTDIVGYYSYGHPVASSSNSGLEQNNEDKALLIFVLDSTNQHNFVVIYDKYADNEGGSASAIIEHDGSLDGANFVLKDDPGDDYFKSPGKFEAFHEWQPLRTDGFALGPIPDQACFNVTIKETTFINYVRLSSDGSTDGTLIEVPKSDNDYVKLEVCNACLSKKK